MFSQWTTDCRGIRQFIIHNVHFKCHCLNCAGWGFGLAALPGDCGAGPHPQVCVEGDPTAHPQVSPHPTYRRPALDDIAKFGDPPAHSRSPPHPTYRRPAFPL